jgi:putative ABC transport system substrate-binding protein
VSQLAVLAASSNPWHPNAVRALEAGALALGVHLMVITLREPSDFEPAFAEIARKRIEGALVLADPLTFFNRGLVTELALRHRLPATFGLREYAEAGGLLSYWAEAETLYRRTAAYVDKLLKGAKAADLPIEQPTKYELVINAGTARALGLTVPPSLLARADEVIE